MMGSGDLSSLQELRDVVRAWVREQGAEIPHEAVAHDFAARTMGRCRGEALETLVAAGMVALINHESNELGATFVVPLEFTTDTHH